MKVELTPEQILTVYECLLLAADDPNLLDKVRRPILDALNSQNDKVQKELYVKWTDQENMRIQHLQQENTFVLDNKVAKMAAVNNNKQPSARNAKKK